MKAIYLFALSIVFGLGIYGIVNAITPTPADLTAGELGTEYNYQFFLTPDGQCDIHILKYRIFYDTGILIDQMTLIYPELTIGFFNPLTKEQEIALEEEMKDDQSVCNYPKDVTYELVNRIEPTFYDSDLSSKYGIKPMYYSDGKIVKLLLRGDVTREQADVIKQDLCNQWVIVGK